MESIRCIVLVFFNKYSGSVHPGKYNFQHMKKLSDQKKTYRPIQISRIYNFVFWLRFADLFKSIRKIRAFAHFYLIFNDFRGLTL